MATGPLASGLVRPASRNLFEPCPEEYIRVDSLDFLSTLGQFYDGILGQVFEGWTVGLNLSKPLQNRAARAQSRIADLSLDQGRLELQDLMLTIRTEVRTAARGVETAGKQIDAARVSRELAGEEPGRRPEALRKRAMDQLPGARDPGGPDRPPAAAKWRPSRATGAPCWPTSARSASCWSRKASNSSTTPTPTASCWPEPLVVPEVGVEPTRP